MEWVYLDIPRMHTALAQWCACLVYIFLLKKRVKNRQAAIILPAFLALQTALLVWTGEVPLFLWAPVMATTVLVMYLMIHICCKGDWKKKVFCTGCAFLLSELAAAFEWLLYYFLVYVRDVESFLLEYILLAGIYAGIFLAAWAAERKLLDRGTELCISGHELFIHMAVVVITFLFSNLSYVYPNTPFSSSFFYESFKIRVFIDLLGVIVLLTLQIHQREQALLTESNAINAALRSQYDKYIQYQENAEVMNMKYHDMKHQIVALRMEMDEERRQAWLDTMESELEAHHNLVDSGDPVLDTILENKLMNARKHHIEITYVIDGKLLRFLHVTDLCTIFGNALDNAIEAEILEPRQEQRMIHVSVSAQRQMVYIKVENFVSHEILMNEGLPGTTKKNRKEHGYGLKSIRYTVEKYNGNMSVTMNREWFVLSIIIPAK